jgi:LacI family transcriptional regulator
VTGRNGPVTLDDVARVSGVSQAAASRALNGRKGVRPDVRERVERVAQSLGYRPNRAARNLASGRSAVIGLVIPSVDLRLDPYGAAVTHAVARAATELDQGLMLVLDTGEPGRSVQHILRDGLIDGVLVSAVAAGEAWVEQLLSADLAAVLIGSHPTRTDVDVVDVENLQSTARIVEHLIDEGCRRIATITGPLERVDATHRLNGFRLAHERRGLAVDEELIAHGDFSRASGAKAAEGLVALRPDGLFAANDEMALGAMRVFQSAGLRVPEDVALAGFDGTSADELVVPSLTTAHQPFAEMARAAVGELLARIDGDPPTGLRLIEPHVTIGGSSQRVEEVSRPPP